MTPLYKYTRYDNDGKLIFTQLSLRKEMQEMLADTVGDHDLINAFPFQTDFHKGSVTKDFVVDPVMYEIRSFDSSGVLVLFYLSSRCSTERYLSVIMNNSDAVSLLDTINASEDYVEIKGQKPNSKVLVHLITIVKVNLTRVH